MCAYCHLWWRLNSDVLAGAVAIQHHVGAAAAVLPGAMQITQVLEVEEKAGHVKHRARISLVL